MKKLSFQFYQKDTCEVAVHLLGQILVHSLNGKLCKGRIVETEAYLGIEDSSCHSYRGRRTQRTEAMYLPAGHAYVYLTYGIRYCLNVVTGNRSQPEAVLIRAVEPLTEVEDMKKRRPFAQTKFDLTNGPSKLCQAFGIDAMLNKENLNGKTLYIEKGVSSKEIQTSARIGLNRNSDSYYWPLRFYIATNPFISRKTSLNCYGSIK